MDGTIDPDRLVSVPFNKTRCGVGFYINATINKDIRLALTENKRFKTDFFSFYFLRKTNGYLLLSFRKTGLRGGMVPLLSPHQQQKWHVDETALGYTFLISREDFVRTFTADKFFVFRLLYCYQADTSPYINATYDEMKEYIRLLGKIRYKLMNPVSDACNIIVSLPYYLLLIINRTYAAAYYLPAEIAKDNFAFWLKDLLEQNIRTHQRVQEYTDTPHVSRITLNNSVKVQFGVSTTHPIRQRLFEELKSELLFSNRTINEIADNFNSSDPNRLMRFLKQQTGKTFTQYMTDYNRGIYE